MTMYTEYKLQKLGAWCSRLQEGLAYEGMTILYMLFL
jgi:hypothetical protein